MSRQPRIQYPGAYYHVMARGDRRERIFEDEEDREIFLKTLGESCERSGWLIYAWVLMDNHYHCIVQTPEPNLVAGMKWLQNTYTRRFNVRHQKWGHVFGGRYKAVIVEGKSGNSGESDYLCAVIDYIHLNPVRAGLVDCRRDLGLLAYRWSSLKEGYAVAARERKGWLAVEQGLKLFGFEDRARDRKHFIKRIEERAAAEKDKSEGETFSGRTLQSTLRRGWYWGSEEFREKLIDCIKEPLKNRNYRNSQLGRDKERRDAEEWIEVGRNHFGINFPIKGRESYKERVAITWALHRKTNQPQKWVAEKLDLRSAANVSQQVRRFQQQLSTDEPEFANRTSKEILEWTEIVKNC